MDVSGRWTDEVIAVSRDVAERVRGREARVIHSGVEIPGANGSGLVPPGSASGLVLGTAGRLAKVKGLGRLLRAVAQLRHDLADVRLEIAGSGPERGSLEAEVRELGLAEHVRFLGWCPDLQPIFAGWDVVVQPSLDEGLPMATLEAMAAGLPVVATAVGGFMEIVEDGKTGWLVPPHDPVALVDRLRSLLLDGQQRHAMGAAGRTRIREHFSVRAMVAQISDVYDRLMQE
jgi:glycosyltransferase involved in cell wall biosynthesis